MKRRLSFQNAFLKCFLSKALAMTLRKIAAIKPYFPTSHHRPNTFEDTRGLEIDWGHHFT